MDHGQVFREQRLPLPRHEPGTKAPPEPFSRHPQSQPGRKSLAGVLIRSRPRVTASNDPQHGLMIEFRQGTSRRGCSRLAAAIARETIGSHEKGQEIALRGPLKPIQSGRQASREGFPRQADPGRGFHRGPNRTAPRCPLASGRRQTGSRTRLEPLGRRRRPAAPEQASSAKRSSNSSGATGWDRYGVEGGISFDQGMRAWSSNLSDGGHETRAHRLVNHACIIAPSRP